MNAYLICSAILVILYFALSVHVSMTRGRTKTGIGTGNDPSAPLAKPSAHMAMQPNTVPNFVALFLYFLMSGASGWITWVVVIVTISRVLHAMGMLMTANFNGPPHPLRAVGAMGTYLCGFALGIALLMRALM